MKSFLLFLPIFLASSLHLSALEPVRWHNEATDTTRINQLLTDAHSKRFASPSARTGWIARQFIGKPYVSSTLEGSEEILTVNLDELDCTTFVELAAALSFTVAERRIAWQDLVYNLRRLRYRGGAVDGYPSRLHYICDWAIDNIHRGNIVDVTNLAPRYAYIVRSIDFMSANSDRYPALADPDNLSRIRAVENNYRNHRFPYIKTTDLASRDTQAFLREGDIIAFVSTLKNLDVTHMGIVVKEDGQTRVLHASSTHGKVEISTDPIDRFVKGNTRWAGIRVFRLKE